MKKALIYQIITNDMWEASNRMALKQAKIKVKN